jgi:hypothetical protein
MLSVKWTAYCLHFKFRCFLLILDIREEGIQVQQTGDLKGSKYNNLVNEIFAKFCKDDKSDIAECLREHRAD